MSEVEFCDLNILKEHASPFNKGMFRISSEYTEWGIYFSFFDVLVFLQSAGLNLNLFVGAEEKKKLFFLLPWCKYIKTY